MDYLLSNCYTSTAQAFARETTASNIALDSAQSKRNRSVNVSGSRTARDSVPDEQMDVVKEDDVSSHRQEELLPSELLRLVELRRGELPPHTFRWFTHFIGFGLIAAKKTSKSTFSLAE